MPMMLPPGYAQKSNIGMGIMSLFLCILFTTIVCAVITQEVEKKPTDKKKINEQRARLGLICLSVPLLLVAMILNIISVCGR